MTFPLNPVLMELLVLALISQNDSYGYEISQRLRQVSSLKDSTLYPVLRRLADNHYVDIYDQRKYYRITKAGKQQREFLEREWQAHILAVSGILQECCREGAQEHE